MVTLNPPKKTILIVEDEHDIRLLYAEILMDAGYEVLQASDGNIGLEMIQNEVWDLLLLDVILPVKDGIRILKEIKDTKDIKKGPVIVLTNLNSEHIIDEAFKLGASGYLIKSEITPDKILDEIKSFVG
ncbi:response regulator [Patescibacteria group bacterium]|nr:response regulator [Patescibacteria group bacterium]